MNDEVKIDFENFPDNLDYDALCNWLINNREDIWFVYEPREVFELYQTIQSRNTKINNILND